MKKKGIYTIFVVSEGASKIFKFKVPVLRGRLGIGILTLTLLLLALLIVDYVNTKSKIFMLKSLKTENQILHEQMLTLANKARKVESELQTIKQLETKVRVMLNAEKPEQSTASFGIGGFSDDYNEYPISNTSIDSNLTYRKVASKMDNVTGRLQIEQSSMVELQEIMAERNSILSSFPSVWPSRGWITSGFGYRVYPFTGENKFHEGIDISTRIGATVVVPADGIVTEQTYDISFGNNIIIDHGYGFVTRYGHLSKIDVKAGEIVKRGTKIGEAGNTGMSTGPHLHYEIRLNGVPVNPENYILN